MFSKVFDELWAFTNNAPPLLVAVLLINMILLNLFSLNVEKSHVPMFIAPPLFKAVLSMNNMFSKVFDAISPLIPNAPPITAEFSINDVWLNTVFTKSLSKFIAPPELETSVFL